MITGYLGLATWKHGNGISKQDLILVTFVDESVLVCLTLFGIETVICALFFSFSFFHIPLWTCLPLKEPKCQLQLQVLGKHGQAEMLRHMAADIQVCELGKVRRENHCRHITASVWEGSI